jgi:hypothetical protein
MDEYFKPKEEFKKCAPNKKYTDGSCFSLESLQKIANSYNKYKGDYTNNKINLNQYKSKLISDIANRISECGSDQLCWLDIDFVKETKDNEILKNTFRPKGPQGRFKWLSTTNINEIVKQYEIKYNDFKFLGAVPYDFEELSFMGIHNLNLDELVESGITKLGIVINFDESWKSGSHWVALYADLLKSNIFYFDSYGTKPKLKIKRFAKKIAKWCYNKKLKEDLDNEDDSDDTINIMNDKKTIYDKLLNIKYNKTQHQRDDSECGVYSINFILRLLKGETFEEINKIRLEDNKVNECRKEYFRF